MRHSGLRTGDRWGDWFVNTERWTLEYRPGADQYIDNDKWVYCVPLYLFNTRSWDSFEEHIYELKHVSWSNIKTIDDFKRAVEEIYQPIMQQLYSSI